MDKAQAIHSFWSGFGLPAYDETTVPTGDNAPEMPYITYGVTQSYLGYPVSLNASLWYNSTSWADIETKLDEIVDYFASQNVCLPIDNGYLWLSLPQNYAQRMSDPTSDTVRRYYLTIQAEFLTAY